MCDNDDTMGEDKDNTYEYLEAWVLTHHRDSHPAMVGPTDAIVAKDISNGRKKVDMIAAAIIKDHTMGERPRNPSDRAAVRRGPHPM